MRITLSLLARGQFQYWNRYVERVMQKEYLSRQWHPLAGWKETKKTDWQYNEHRPWTTEFLRANKQKKGTRVFVEPIQEWKIFKGDRVEILVGKDKGKHGLVNSIIKERNWVYVEGLNLEYTIQKQVPDVLPTCVAVEKPLLVTNQVKLVDPGDELPTDIEWRYTEDGERVRVSVRSGRIIPLPNGFYELEDFVNPKAYIANPDKDTSQSDLLEVTFKPKLCTFEQDIFQSMGIKDDRKPAPTYWY